MSEATETRTLPQLLSALTSDLSNLFRKEAELVRAEISEKMHRAALGGSEVAAGALCLLTALNAIVAALIIALAKVMDPGWAALLVGVVLALVGGALLRTGIKNAKPDNLAPERAARQLEKDAQMVREQVR